MRVYSLSVNDEDFLGFAEKAEKAENSDNDKIIDLTRAISFYEITACNYVSAPVRYIEELLWEDKFNADFLGEVMSTVSKYGAADEFTIEDEYKTNAPVTPGKIIALGNNYHEHVKEMNHSVPEEPILFGKWPSCVIGHEDAIVKPAGIGRVDYEAELAILIGSTAKNVKKADAMSHISGYTCMNDVSARDVQIADIGKSLPWMTSKNYDTFAPMGPCILLAESVPEPVSVQVQSALNGESKQNGNTSDFIFDIPTIIEYITNIMTLEPGDVITTGTPVGVGPIEPGDVIEITCGGIGTLSNPVISSDK
ncbi:fumarylacetoacetate hydrolase family protein [Candidatus Latescibacterota bacterium]